MNSTFKIYTGLFILTSLLLFIVFSSKCLLLDPTSTHFTEKNLPPSFAHWFGTDALGRDFFSRTVQGLQISILVGLFAFIIDLTIGILWGSVAAFSPPRIDSFLLRMAGVLNSLHPILVGITLSLFFGSGLLPILASIFCVGWVQVALTTRILVKTSLSTEYTISAIALGASPLRLFFMHIFPDIAGVILSASMLSIPQAIFMESSLSFLGIGIQPPMSSLGSIINDSLPSLRFFPWKLYFPVGLLSIFIFSILLLVDGINTKYNPKKLIREHY